MSEHKRAVTVTVHWQSMLNNQARTSNGRRPAYWQGKDTGQREGQGRDSHQGEEQLSIDKGFQIWFTLMITKPHA